jgi:hypothetical protein
MSEILDSFEEYCVNPEFKESRKTFSYRRAIQYFCDYLGENSIDDELVSKFKKYQLDIGNKDSLLYKKFLSFLAPRKQSSYLYSGYLSAALPEFFAFWKNYKNQEKIPPIFFANVTWMERYDGLEIFKKPGAAWVKENNDAHEKNNFKEIDGKYYGYVECSRNSKINISTIANRYGCVIKEENGNRFIENIHVIYFSTSPKGKARIVGFYNKAIIFENYMKNPLNGDRYYFVCGHDDGILIPEKDRNFIVEKSYGQDQRWYADKDEDIPFVKKTLEYIKKYTIIANLQEQQMISNMLVKLKSDLEVEFDKNKITGILPINNYHEHTYHIGRIGGTEEISVKKIRNGRRAEKYFVDYLAKNGFKKGKDFDDVANDRNYGYDMQFADIGIEIKNIQSGSFYLTDNEIAHLESGKTHLILVDLDNGIWLLKNNSDWLRITIENIKSIRDYCKEQYSNIVLTDIKINITDDIKKEIFEISQFDYDKILDILIGTK